jgi:hypothetical protein
MSYYQDICSYTLYYIQSSDFHNFQIILILRLITLNFYVLLQRVFKTYICNCWRKVLLLRVLDVLNHCILQLHKYVLLGVMFIICSFNNMSISFTRFVCPHVNNTRTAKMIFLNFNLWCFVKFKETFQLD